MKLTKKQYWWVYGTAGTVLLGSGLTIAIEAGHWKHMQEPFLLWTGAGVVGIGSVISGVVFLIRASIIYREIYHENNNK